MIGKKRDQAAGRCCRQPSTRRLGGWVETAQRRQAKATADRALPLLGHQRRMTGEGVETEELRSPGEGRLIRFLHRTVVACGAKTTNAKRRRKGIVWLASRVASRDG